MKRPQPQDFFKDWKAREALAEAMIPLIGKLYRENNVSLYMYGRNMVNRSVTDLMKAHRFVRQIEQNELSEFETFPMIQTLAEMDLGPAHVDIGKLTVGYQEHANGRTPRDYLQEVIGNDIGAMRKPLPQPQDVVLYGFGRIGRLIARILIEKTGGGDALRLRAIVVRKGRGPEDLEKRASLLRRDSVHGPFRGTIRVLEEESKLICNGNEIQVIEADSPAEIDYTRYGIDNAIVVDNTGAWRDEAGLGRHLQCAGAAKVILTAPGKGNIPNIVYGINHHEIQPDQRILSAASCTTNAIVPVLKAVFDEYGIRTGHVETVHAYTNDQNVQDQPHKDLYRARAAALNIIPTTTGAAKAVGLVIPELQGKLTGIAMRVPVPTGSVVDLTVNLGKAATTESINEAIKSAAEGPLKGILKFATDPIVSSDIVHDPHSSIFAADFTQVLGDKLAKVVSWYDNEWGYSCRTADLAAKMGGML